MAVGKPRVTLLDGYVDEPSCLGVPPYISPYVRYTWGALLDAGLEEERLEYLTADDLRGDWEGHLSCMARREMVVAICGTTVPGRYLGGRPLSLAEIGRLAGGLSGCGTRLVIGGPIVLACREALTGCGGPGEVVISDETCALGIYDLLGGTGTTNANSGPGGQAELVGRWSRLGAGVVVRHPNFPHLVCEIETYRGCLRKRGCAFCSERIKRVLYSRRPEEITGEVSALYLRGVRCFRLGAQADLFLYGAEETEGDYPRPRPDRIAALYRGLHRAAPGLEVLHMDNVSPGTIARFPEESERILETVVRYNTPGDTAAFGLESADPEVIGANSIGTEPEETFRAVELMNRFGSRRSGGVPKLLPGLNFLHGLMGETERTLELNLNFLRRILNAGLLLRRINIRQVRPLPGYEAVELDRKGFEDYKQTVNREINRPMLTRVFPVGTVLRRVHLEEVRGRVTYGRQLGTYPILVGVPGRLKPGEILDLRVVDYGYRSVTGLPVPFNINRAGLEQLEALPGVGRNRAMRIFLSRPLDSERDLEAALDEGFDVPSILPFIDSFRS